LFSCRKKYLLGLKIITRGRSCWNGGKCKIIRKSKTFRRIRKITLLSWYKYINKLNILYFYKKAALALEVIPKTLAQNCGADVVRLITELRAKHSEKNVGLYWGVNGNIRKIADKKEIGVWEPLDIKKYK